MKIDKEVRLGAWQVELEELSANFKKLCGSRQRKCSGKEGSEVVRYMYVAQKHLEMLKRVMLI